MAYLATLAFLDELYARTGNDFLGMFVGSMALLPDGLPVDRANRQGWQRVVEKELSAAVAVDCNSDHAYLLCVQFLWDLHDQTQDEELRGLLELLQPGGGSQPMPWLVDLWKQSFARVEHGLVDPGFQLAPAKSTPT